MGWIGCFCWLVGAAIVADSAFAQDTYRFSGDERVTLRVGEWKTTDRVFLVWDGLAGEYSVDAGGQIAIPLVGTISALGKSTEELSDDISAILQRTIGLPEPPAVAIEIADYRPIYVLGAVMTPGSYRFSRLMTVEQGLAMAGGMFRLAGDPGTGAGSRAIQIQNEIDLLAKSVQRLQLAQARLSAEISAYDSGDLDSRIEFDGSTSQQGLLEATVMEANREFLRNRRQSLQELQDLLGEQIDGLSDEIVLRDGQIAGARENLDAAEALAERGLTVASRVNELTFALSEYEAKRLQLSVARLTAQQRLNEARREEATLVGEARSQRLAELKTTMAELDDARVRLRGARSLLVDASLSASTAVDEVAPAPVYRVTRLIEGETGSVYLNLTDPLKPGDTLTVELQWPAPPAN